MEYQPAKYIIEKEQNYYYIKIYSNDMIFPELPVRKGPYVTLKSARKGIKKLVEDEKYPIEIEKYNSKGELM